MQLLLDEIADVRMGLTLRGADASRRTIEGGLHYIRISDLSETGDLVIGERHPIDPGQASDHRHRVKPGDILLANRGTRMTAAMVTDEIDAIAGSQLFIVRLKSSQVLPGFLHAYLNLESTQEHLRSHARGTYVQTLSVAILRSLPIPIPSLETQEKIASLVACAAEERRLLAELANKRRQTLELSLSRLLSLSPPSEIPPFHDQNQS